MQVVLKVEKSNQISTEANVCAHKNQRFLGLDAFRGLAIIGMVFSGVFPHENYWPNWMFHAQVGPPNFLYTPGIPGITWVDLVFPFFLFAMGAAFPLAMNTKLLKGGYSKVVISNFKRFLWLAFFAITIRYLNPAWLQGPRWINLITALLAFGAYFMVFMRFDFKIWKQNTIKLLGVLIIFSLVSLHSNFTTYTFSKGKSDIILLVLANMAFFGSLIWMVTYKNQMLRMGAIALFSAIWITRQIPGSWTTVFVDFHPSLSWLYRFEFLKYLCVVLPGSILGDLLLKYGNDSQKKHEQNPSKKALFIIAGITFMFIIFNLFTLFERLIYWNLAGNLVLGIFGFVVLSTNKNNGLEVYRRIFAWGFFFIVLGMFFEPYEGGIKKDPSSFSFWFLTSCLAFIFFIFCDIITRFIEKNVLWSGIVKSGQNPMIAYVANSFFIVPVLGLLHILPVFDFLREQHIVLGIIKALVLTTLVIIITTYCTNRKWLWRT